MKTKTKILIVIISALLLTISTMSVVAFVPKFNNIVSEDGREMSGEEIENRFTNASERIKELGDKDNIIAKINSEDITNYDIIEVIVITSLSNEHSNLSKEEMLQYISKNIVISQEIKRYGLELSEEETNEFYERALISYENDKEESDEAIKILGITKAEFCSIIANSNIRIKNQTDLLRYVSPLLISGEISIEDEQICNLIDRINDPDNSDNKVELITLLNENYLDYLVRNANIEVFK